MTSKRIWSAALIVASCLAFLTPAQADTLKDDENHVVIGIVAVVAAIAVVTVVLVYHYKKHSITGCVTSGQGALALTNENNSQVYTLSGDTADVKPGRRMKVQGKKIKSDGADQPPLWEATKVIIDLGVCRP
ncbi:MAG: hypothetical protein ABSE92_09715 [Terriglobales bacterium]